MQLTPAHQNADICAILSGGFYFGVSKSEYHSLSV